MVRKYAKDDDGSGTYANAAMPHDALREMSKLYIKAYQAGQKAVVPEHDQIFYWYRPSPKAAVATGDPLPRVSFRLSLCHSDACIGLSPSARTWCTTWSLS
jgi:hypothetical protein